MASTGRVIMGLFCLATAGAGEAAAPRPVRLALSLHALETGTEVAYHPRRWLTIRRSIAFVRPDPLRELTSAASAVPLRARAFAMTGDIHPFRDGFRVSLGMREDQRRRLLRATGDTAEVGTQRYAPMISVGAFGEIAPGLSVGGDFGLLGQDLTRAGGGVLVTPVDLAETGRGDGGRYRPVAQLSMGYRF